MKRICLLITTLMFLSFSILPAAASNMEEEYLNDSLEQIDSELTEQIPDESKDLLSELGLTELNLQQILALNPQQFLQLFQTLFYESCQEPFRVFGKMLGVLLLSALLFSLKDTLLKEEIIRIYSFVASICLCSVLLESLIGCIRSCVSSLDNSSNFLLALIPILTALLSVGGQAATASVYQLLLFTACQLTAQLVSGVAAALLGIYSAIGILAAVFPSLSLQGFVDGIKRLLCWGIGIITTLFVSFLSLQTFVTANVDVVTLKASRFLMGSLIPVVGTILSEAYGAAQGCLLLLRSTVGTFGIIAALCMLLPVLLRTVLWCVVTWLGVQVSTMLQVKELSNLLKNTNNSFTILLAMQLSMLLLSIVAVALVLFIGTGG